MELPVELNLTACPGGLDLRFLNFETAMAAVAVAVTLFFALSLAISLRCLGKGYQGTRPGREWEGEWEGQGGSAFGGQGGAAGEETRRGQSG